MLFDNVGNTRRNLRQMLDVARALDGVSKKPIPFSSWFVLRPGGKICNEGNGTVKFETLKASVLNADLVLQILLEFLASVYDYYVSSTV